MKTSTYQLSRNRLWVVTIARSLDLCQDKTYIMSAAVRSFSVPPEMSSSYFEFMRFERYSSFPYDPLGELSFIALKRNVP